MGGIDTDASATEFCEAGYGNLHQINVTSSNSIDKGEKVD